jgi:hypothetical protein
MFSPIAGRIARQVSYRQFSVTSGAFFAFFGEFSSARGVSIGSMELSNVPLELPSAPLELPFAQIYFYLHRFWVQNDPDGISIGRMEKSFARLELPSAPLELPFEQSIFHLQQKKARAERFGRPKGTIYTVSARAARGYDNSKGPVSGLGPSSAKTARILAPIDALGCFAP